MGPRGGPKVGFPTTRVCRFRYCQSFLLNPSNSGSAVGQYFRANSPFDPNVSSPTGRHALGVNQWAPFYSYYMVIGSRCMVKFQRTQSNATANSLVGIFVTNSTTLLSSSATHIREQGLAKTRDLIGAQTGYRPPLVKKGFSPKKFFNVKDLKDVQERIGAVVNVDDPEFPPSDGDAWYLVFAAVNIPGGETGAPIECTLTIDYAVLFSDPNELPDSTITP